MSKASGKRWAQILVQAALLVASAYFIWHAWAGAAGTRPVSYSEFIENIRQGRVEAVQISATELLGKLRADAGAEQTQSGVAPKPQVISAVRPPGVADPELLPLLRERNVQVVGRVEQGGWLSALFLSAFPILLLIGFWLWSFRRFAGQGAEALNFGRNRAKIYDRSDKEKVTFEDVAGVEEAEAELAEELQRRETIGREELERIVREAEAGESSVAAA